MDDGPILKLNSSWAPLPSPVKKALPHLTSKTCSILHEIYTDLENVYGGAVSRNKEDDSLFLWRLSIDDTGKLCMPSSPDSDGFHTVQLPHSELQERSLEDILTEALSNGAWY
jgi:hypothetical protein